MKNLPGKLFLILEVLMVFCLVLAGIGLIANGGIQRAKPAPSPTVTMAAPAPIPTLTDVPTVLPPAEQTSTLEPTPDVPVVITPLPPRISGVTPTGLQAKLRLRNIACSSRNNNMLDGQSFYSWSCSRDDYDIQYFVTITSQDLDNVDAIHAAVLQTSIPTGKLQASFLGYVATLVFPKQPALAAEARLWVEKTLPILTGESGDIHNTSIGGIDFQLFGPASARTLFIGNLK